MREKEEFNAAVLRPICAIFSKTCLPQPYREGFSTLPGLWPLVPKTIFLTDPECIEEMLVARAELFPRDKTTVRSLSAPVNRESLFFAEGANWKWQRRAAAPAFRHDNLLALVPTRPISSTRMTAPLNRDVHPREPLNARSEFAVGLGLLRCRYSIST